MIAGVAEPLIPTPAAPGPVVVHQTAGADPARRAAIAERRVLVGQGEKIVSQLVRGGEGATKLVTVRVIGGASNEDARKAARAIANSPLVKTAIHGGDPNWGRLGAVMGRSGAAFRLDGAAVRIGDIELFRDGTPYDERAPEAAEYLKATDIDVEVDLGTGGDGRSTMWTCDLTAEYVRINAEYRT